MRPEIHVWRRFFSSINMQPFYLSSPVLILSEPLSTIIHRINPAMFTFNLNKMYYYEEIALDFPEG